jgi:hypothetical protein
MDSSIFNFHGNLEQIKKLEEILKKLPEETILHKIDKKPHSFFDVSMSGNTAVIYPRYLSEELIICPNVKSVCDKESVAFSIDNYGYRIFFNKNYISEKD